MDTEPIAGVNTEPEPAPPTGTTTAPEADPVIAEPTTPIVPESTTQSAAEPAKTEPQPQAAPAPETRTPTIPTTETAKGQEIDPTIVQGEAGVLVTTMLNRTTNEGAKKYKEIDEKDIAAQDQFLTEHPEIRILMDIDTISKLEDGEYKSGEYTLDDPGTEYTNKGHVIGEIIKVEGETFTYTISGTTATDTISRADLVAQMVLLGRDDILKNFEGNASQQELVDFIISRKDAGAKIPDPDQLARIRSLTKEVISGNGYSLLSLRTMARKALPRIREPRPTDPNIADLEEIRAENDRREAIMNDLTERFNGRTVATVADMKYVFDLCGMTTGGMPADLDKVHDNIYSLESRLSATRDAGERARIQDQLDTARATLAVIQAGQDAVTETTLDEHFKEIINGNVSVERITEITRAMESLDPTTLVLIANPDANVNLTEEQIRAKREQQEKIDKYLKTLGIAGGALALLIALGLVSGAKG